MATLVQINGGRTTPRTGEEVLSSSVRLLAEHLARGLSQIPDDDPHRAIVESEVVRFRSLGVLTGGE